MTQPTQTQPKPTFTPQPQLKPKDFSPYATLIAQAIDLNPPLMGGQQPYAQMQPQQGVGQQLAVNPDFIRMVTGR
jgi:hypothetical protein